VKSIRSLLVSASEVSSAKKSASLKPTYFLFCDRKTGAARFRVEPEPDGRLPMEHAASLLAIYCLAHHRSPQDFMVVFGAQDEFFADVTSRAATLLNAAGVYADPVGISRREQEVLKAVSQNLCNKEIAARMGISERTVKFHVSSLLSKLGARDRVELARFCSENSLPPAWFRSHGGENGVDARNTPREAAESQLAEPETFAQKSDAPKREKSNRMIRMPNQMALAVS
jgi:DNA-binding CsgD family transcriptional regulator